MKSLSSDWFIEGRLDFEYKKYLLLAYLQHVSQEFAAYRLYPSLADLVAHHRTLMEFQKQKQDLINQFPKEINPDAFRQMSLVLDSQMSDHHDLQEIDSIVQFSIPRIQHNLDQGIERFEEVERKLLIEPIGITPLYRREGYLFLRQEPDPSVAIYEYRIIFLEHTDGRYHGIHVDPLEVRTLSLSLTYEHIKWELAKKRTQLPNPATFLVKTSPLFPPEEAILPVVKRRMMALLKD